MSTLSRIIVCLGLALAVAACSKDGEEDGSSTQTTEQTTPKKKKKWSPVDEEGVLKPAEVEPYGMPLPTLTDTRANFGRESTYEAQSTYEKLLQFYVKRATEDGLTIGEMGGGFKVEDGIGNRIYVLKPRKGRRNPKIVAFGAPDAKRPQWVENGRKINKAAAGDDQPSKKARTANTANDGDDNQPAKKPDNPYSRTVETVGGKEVVVLTRKDGGAAGGGGETSNNPNPGRPVESPFDPSRANRPRVNGPNQLPADSRAY